MVLKKCYLIFSLACIYIVPSIAYGLTGVDIKGDNYAGIIDSASLFFIIAAIVLVVELFVVQQWKDISVVGDWRLSLRLNAFLISFLIFGYGLLYLSGLNPEPSLELNRGLGSSSFFLFYVVLSIPIQQYVVTGDIFYKARYLFKNLPYSIPFTAVIYSAFHLYYPENSLILIGTFLIGLYWLYVYQRSQSMVGNILSHIVFGIGAMFLNLA